MSIAINNKVAWCFMVQLRKMQSKFSLKSTTEYIVHCTA